MTTRKLLTHARQAETAKPEAKPYKLKVDRGLFLEVMPTGSKRWRFRYQFAGKEQMISFGLFPDVGLLEAKERREAARKMLANGINPSIRRRTERVAQKAASANTFEAMAREWLARQTDKSDSTRSKAEWLLSFAIAEFGTLPVNEVTPPMVLEACRKQERAGKLETAQRIRSKCSQVFRYAVSTGRAQLDPTRDLQGALKPAPPPSPRIGEEPIFLLKGKADIGDKINTQIIQPLIEANERLARSDFPDFNDPNKLGEGKDMVDRLSDLVGIFQKPELDFSKNRAEHDDILGDAYEYLMRHFATESGKSKGQFYTPSEVSRIIAKVIGISPKNTKASTTAYDPTCGSGSLLLKVAAEAGKHITLEGQEKDVTTAGLARMNMILHDFPTANIVSGNTLANPKFLDGNKLRTYDYVVANPPFSDKTWTSGLTPANDPCTSKSTCHAPSSAAT